MQENRDVVKKNSLDTYIGYLRDSGYHPIKTASCWWYDAYHQKSVYFSLPLHRKISPSQDELRHVFHQRPGTLALRFISPGDSNLGHESYEWVYRSPYSLDQLSSNNRSKIRRGLRRCDLRPMTFSELAELGRRARKDTLARHGKDSDQDSVDLSMDSCPNFEAWGAFVGEELAAYLITLWVEDWAHLLVNRSSNKHLKNYPNNALIFSTVEELLSRPGLSAISYGWEPLEEHESLDHFKSGMGAKQEIVRQSLVLRPWVKTLLRPAMCRLLSTGARQFPANSRMQKLAGLLHLATKRDDRIRS
jgi:hypothetical protein